MSIPVERSEVAAMLQLQVKTNQLAEQVRDSLLQRPETKLAACVTGPEQVLAIVLVASPQALAEFISHFIFETLPGSPVVAVRTSVIVGGAEAMVAQHWLAEQLAAERPLPQD